MGVNTTYKEFRGYLWQLVYYLDVNRGSFFSSETEAKNCNLENRFSILDSVPRVKNQSAYTFLLEYPIEYKNKFIIWQQSLSPIDDIEEKDVTSAKGFALIRNNISSNFKGLVKTSILNLNNCVSTLLDGNPGDQNWYYSIGMHSSCGGWSSIPGPKGSVKITELWVRIRKIRNGSNCAYYQKKHMIQLLMSIIMILVS